ncbi:MAG: hypothetical protein ABJH68_02765 [Ilumatobacter sp.]|uniref:hypothetical protein n=1 Tax=Ilumatobacter sp. TaxID=1967498 RepID=UPI003298E17D
MSPPDYSLRSSSLFDRRPATTPSIWTERRFGGISQQIRSFFAPPASPRNALRRQRLKVLRLRL